MAASKAPIDESAVSPDTSQGTFRRIIVLPPAGATRQQFETIIALFERELLRRGIKTISGGMMREALNAANAASAANSAVATPSSSTPTAAPSENPGTELDRILKEARKLGADAILQINDWTWSRDAVPSRFFALLQTSEGGEFHETSEPEYHSFNGPKYSFASPELRFVGRLFNVENGEVLGSFEVRSPSNFNLPGRYVANVEVRDRQPSVQFENFVYASPGWAEDARRKTETAVVMAVCNRMMPARNLSSPTAVTPAPPIIRTNEAPPKPENKDAFGQGSFGADPAPAKAN